MTIYRVIDANINRAREGIRVIEDELRFIFEKKELSERLRSLRHEISRIPSLLNISSIKLLVSRQSQKDVGKKRIESKRKNLQEIIASNFSRVEESIRVLEEYSKLINSKVTDKIKKIRFDLYVLQKEIQLSIYRKELTSKLGLYIITDEKIAGKSNAKIVVEAVKGGADTIQLRDKTCSDKKLCTEAKKIRTLIPQRILFIVNDRVDIALAVEADGVHLGKDDLSITEAREIIGEDKIIGISCDSVKEAIKAEKDGADYVALGPIFPTTTKKDVPYPLGIKVIKEAKKKISIPIVAIGGINEKNIGEALKSGADSVAVISAVLKNSNISASVTCLKKYFSKP
ncbi:MAG: thiamine phosphate synthase, partial [Candidatus Omnitrophica bacterium]|nr:thiamine phosphate synthase [Candidatus Omnitrophota bacterium]